ncbi:hypothetical protein C1645_805894 [Glomus cerebriforme]|uniref:Ubiquitin-like domain-containing protein n=1 Tax=Glomus cerebriforme TaxID=658196 RepID=A0A397T296_9GLOM|nr:hypothetical protein C1645_805894 [Glomus cerebriforme]
MSQLALVASAMSSILNIPVKTYDECVANGYIVSSEQILDINFIHRNSLMRFGQEVKKSEDTLFTQKSSIGIQIFVKNLFGESQAMFVNPQNTVLELKHAIQEKFDYDIRLIRLEFANKRLEDNRTLKSYNIKQGDNLHISLRLLGGNFDMEYCVINNFCVIEKNFLDPSYDFDFTHLRDEGETHIRGNHLYKRPYGWNRIALNVKKYNFDSDYKWLGHVGNSPYEWPVSYHGTKKDSVNSIADNGYLLEKGTRFKFGRGIYSTPEVHTAEKYATDFEYDGEKYKVVFQNRVNTVGLGKRKDGNYTYWLTPKEKDIIPYGLCTKKINSYCAS